MRNIVFIGNCHASHLGQVYLDHIGRPRGEAVHCVAAYEEADAAANEQIDNADLIVFQVTDREQKVPLPSGKRLVVFPFVTAFFLWPYGNGEHPRRAEVPPGYDPVFAHEFGDRWLDREMAGGAAPDTLAERYRDLDVAKATSVDRIIEFAVAAQRARDARTDTNFSDYIMGRLATERSFISVQHPDRDLFCVMAREVFARMGCGSEEIEAALATCRYTPFPALEAPVHPRIAEHLGLKWAPPEYKYNSPFGDRLTWTEFCDRYVAHDWARELQDCLARARQPDLARDELERLATDLETASARYASGDGLYALSRTRARLGDIAGAIDAVEAALRSLPYAWNFKVFLAELQAHAGRLDEALANAQDVAAWMPQAAIVHVTLGNIQRTRGCREGMLSAARAVLALVPDHPVALDLLAEGEREGA